MELIERAAFLDTMQHAFQNVDAGEGHCIFVSGEAGIGKTSLVREFCNRIKNRCDIYQGTCDALFSPRPLAPLYDILLQVWNNLPEYSNDMRERTKLFTEFFFEIKSKEKTSVIVFEDIHWADEATLDFIKFFARRITQLRCLFILTYRDDEIHSRHPLRNVLGQINPGSFTRLQLLPLSKEAVEKMTEERGYKGEDVYKISEGNPFYVNEILASYSLGVPDNIKDSVLSSYNRVDENAKNVWQILSVIPNGFEIKYLEKMEPSYTASIYNCLDLRILIPKDGLIFFKHELFRRTIEDSLSPLLRIELNKKILQLFKASFEENKQIERIIHHAKNANDNALVVKYAPLAAERASCLGAHTEASKLYLTAIEYYQGHDRDTIVRFYESFAYESYLTNQINEAIIYQDKALQILQQTNDVMRIGDCMRFLSRLWWFEGNTVKAETYARQAIELFDNQPASKAKAYAFSNMSQLKMLSEDIAECRIWSEKAIAMAKDLDDSEVLSHALINVGLVDMRTESTRQKGREMLRQSLDIAVKNGYDENAARAYTNLSTNAVRVKEYDFAKNILDEGIAFCEERDLHLARAYLLGYKARLYLETGDWTEALRVANIVMNDDQPSVSKIGALVVVSMIKVRRGDTDALPFLLQAKEKALKAKEPQRLMPAMIALLEYEWITGRRYIETPELDEVLSLIEKKGNIYENSAFSFWLLKARNQRAQPKEFFEGYEINDEVSARKAATLWNQLGCPYEEALVLFEGNEDDKKTAIEIVHNLGADAIYEKMKFEMRTSGIKNIPRGLRQSTMSNPANLTQRELDVLHLLKEGLQNKEIADRLFVSPKTVAQHISSIFFKLDVNSRTKAVQEATRKAIIK